MRTCCLAIVLLLGLGAGNEEATEKPSVPNGRRLITEGDNLVAIYYQDHGLASSGGVQMIVAAWDDGFVVWSDDKLKGGPPYRSGQITPDKVDQLFKKLEHEGTFERKSLNDPQYGPDSDFVTISVKHDGQKLEMESWHELYEGSGKMMATSLGVGPRDEKKWAVLAKEPADYLVYRLVWSELRCEVERLITHESKPTSGKVMMRAGKMWWQEF